MVLASVEAAAKNIAGAVEVTDFDRSRTLSEMFSAKVWLKRENLQFTGSFKERGALNKLLTLNKQERSKGVIAMSAGNHAQGVAYHAQRLGIPAFIVMPEPTPTVKVENTRGHGATVILKGNQLEESAEFAHEYGREHGLTFVHPYDDPLVIAGQGTIALEMLGEVPDLDVLVVPIGGGGLISGISIAAKAIRPEIEVIGVQARLYPSMYNAIRGEDLPMRGDTLAEGIAVKSPGKITTPIVRKFVDDFVLVSEAQLERAVSLLIGIEKTVVEGAGAAGLAAMIAQPQRFKGRKVGLVLCGGNIDTRLLASVLTRELARQGCLTQLTIDIPDRPGQLATVSRAIAEAEANVVEVYHQRVFTDLPAKGAELHVVIETRDRAHLQRVIADLEACGYDVSAKGAPE
ncbi:MAG: threonine dehydratase [Alphaproteobacteria bacterium BRH_c36]|nr:MAG: threonine dehydratase [Alphaproteobacteria bacterium BRH_c36]